MLKKLDAIRLAKARNLILRAIRLKDTLGVLLKIRYSKRFASLKLKNSGRFALLKIVEAIRLAKDSIFEAIRLAEDTQGDSPFEIFAFLKILMFIHTAVKHKIISITVFPLGNEWVFFLR